MSLFNRKRSVVALGEEAIYTIKSELESVLAIARSYDDVMVRTGEPVISLEGRIRGDLLAFVLYLSGITRGVDPREIAVVNNIFDLDLWHVDFELFYEEVSDDNFAHAVPPSILIINELGSQIQHAMAQDKEGVEVSIEAARSGVTDIATAFSDDLINLYALVGSAFISADTSVTRRESEELCQYLYMMKRAVNGPKAELPEGAARRAVLAHVRLFGRPPLVR